MNFNVLLDAHYLRVNAALQQFIMALPFQSSPLVNAMEYGALLGGKRLRPFLVYATGEMLQADDAALDAPAAAGASSAASSACSICPVAYTRKGRSRLPPNNAPYSMALTSGEL